MVKCVTVCCGPRDNPHDPTVMKVDKNGVDIFRIRGQMHEYEKGDLVLTEDRGWEELALKMGASDWTEFEQILYRKGGDYYGSSDRYVCTICGSTICWRD